MLVTMVDTLNYLKQRNNIVLYLMIVQMTLHNSLTTSKSTPIRSAFLHMHKTQHYKLTGYRTKSVAVNADRSS